MASVEFRLSQELGVREQQVKAAVDLLDEGSTVPFIARYRKEATQGLDDSQLRLLEERLRYLRELDERKKAIIDSIAEQGKLTDALEKSITEAESKARVEDLYLPFKKKRRTKAQIAREAGLEPLAEGLLANPTLDPEEEARAYLDPQKGVEDTKAALDGAKQILLERFSEDPELAGSLRSFMSENGRLTSDVIEGKENEGAKFADYFSFSEPIRKIPSHRALAMFRGRNEEILRLGLTAGEEGEAHCIQKIAARFGITDRGRAADSWLSGVARWTWKIKLALRIEMDLMGDLRERAEEEAITVFAGNLRDLLMAAPAGERAVLALDPGYRTGVKVAVVDATGKLIETDTIYPHEPQKKWDQSLSTLHALCVRHGVGLVSIGNGTASRETDKLVGDLISNAPDLGLTKVTVSEAGASVYSASELAAREFPNLDVSLRGAVSIGRRLQDPLAELVKIDPKSIGVGQYQHDVSAANLDRSLKAVVEDCVNAVGVDLNTASKPLLAQVSGLSESLAQSIVEHRDVNGAFKNREELLKVARLGPKAFEQAAGFLRIRGGENPIDQSGVHPETYPVVGRILKAAGKPMAELLGDSKTLRALSPEDFADERFGVMTVKDIVAELEKPGRDPRPEFKTATFKEGVEKISDLKPGMVLEGVISNVTNFGAFVDIGVHQDGLVHISQLADKFVEDPRAVVKAGDVVKVKVLDLDLPRKRISLTMRLKERSEPQKERKKAGQTPQRPKKKNNRNENKDAGHGGAMADALRRAGIKK